MKTSVFFLFMVCLIIGGRINAQDGQILERKVFTYRDNEELLSRIGDNQNGKWLLKPGYDYLDQVNMEEIFY